MTDHLLPPSSSSAAPATSTRALHYSCLVHNVSHSDLLMAISTRPSTDAADRTAVPALEHTLIVRAAFNRYLHVTTQLLEQLQAVQQQLKSDQIVQQLSITYDSEVLGRECQVVNNHDVQQSKLNGHAEVDSDNDEPPAALQLPYGLKLPAPHQPHFTSWENFRVRSGADYQCTETLKEQRVVAIVLPLLAIIVPRWLQAVREQCTHSTNSDDQRLILYLICGSGTPWKVDDNPESNSTRSAALIIQIFLSIYYPRITVTILDSAQRTEAFHFDDNIRFVNGIVRPRIDAHIRELAAVHYENWSDYFSLYISLTEGASARIAALNASMRQFRPTTLHVWQLKSFWYAWSPTGRVDGKLLERDVEAYHYDSTSTEPAIATAQLVKPIQLLVAEMRSHRDNFLKALDTSEGRHNELKKFWLRKSQSPVLAVVMVRKQSDKKIRFYRGMNLEVSMPTGSLCAERNALGSACSHDPQLTRNDFKAVAVLAVPLQPVPLELLKAIQSPLHTAAANFQSPIKLQLTANNHAGKRLRRDSESDAGGQMQAITPLINSPAHPPKRPLADRSSSLTLDTTKAAIDAAELKSPTKHIIGTVADVLQKQQHSPRGSALQRVGSHLHLPSSAEFAGNAALQQGSVKSNSSDSAANHLSASNASSATAPPPPRLPEDKRNPIAPCGSCNEWLRKIAEVNPDLKIVTFPSIMCDSAFVKPVKFF